MHWFHLCKQNNSVSMEINNNQNKNKMARFASICKQEFKILLQDMNNLNMQGGTNLSWNIFQAYLSY